MRETPDLGSPWQWAFAHRAAETEDTEVLAEEAPRPASPRRTRSVVGRRPARAETVAPEPADVSESEPEQEPEPSDPPIAVAEESSESSIGTSTRRGRSRKISEGVVTVNVTVPRGLARKIDGKLVRAVAESAIQRDGWQHPATLDVIFVTDDEIRDINARRRGIDEVTDVLSFPLVELQPEHEFAGDFFVLPPEATTHLGDVVISFSRVEAQAEEGGHSLQRELAFLTLHGVLHILGYDHEVDDERRRMRRREEEVLAEFGLRRNGA